MDRLIGKYSEALYAIMRIIIGLLFACHGAQKLFGLFGGLGNHELSPLLIVAGVIEFVGGILIAIGFMAGYAAFIASGQMAAAYFMAHASGGFLPIINKGEPAVIYCFIFLYIASRGSGILSVDKAVVGAHKKQLHTSGNFNYTE
jgi:putative oxidoreductase